MNANRQKSNKESKMKITTIKIIGWSGLSVIVAGLIFAGIQPFHPADVLSSVTTSAWAIISSLQFNMSILFLLGITGIYAWQVEKSGCAVTLFPVVKRQNESLALGFIGSRILEASTIFAGVVCLMTIISLRQSGQEQKQWSLAGH
jgi:hypothetical protein